MSMAHVLFGRDSFLGKAANIMGLGLPNLLWDAMTPSAPKMQPVRIGELAQQDAQEGQARAIVYGIGRPIGPTLIYMSDPVRKMVKTYVGKSGGKGGSKKKKKQYQDVEHIYRSYAMGICEGPITGIRRVWRNGQLVFDGRKGSAWGAANNGRFLSGKEFYLGDWNQQPSPTLQSLLGADIPAFRGTCYFVVKNEDLTSSNGAIPQYVFEVARAEGQIVTSRLYPLENEDALAPSAVAPSVSWSMPPMDSMSVSMLPPAVYRRPLVRYLSYDKAEPEALSVAMLVPSVNRVTEVRYLTYDKAEPESLAVSMLAPTVFRQKVADYYDYTIPEESLAIAMLAPTVSIE